jgi:hypothetical protein
MAASKSAMEWRNPVIRSVRPVSCYGIDLKADTDGFNSESKS